MQEVHFQFDLIQIIPFQVRQQVETKVFFRPINSIDGFLYSQAPQVTQNLLNQKAIEQNKLIKQEYEQMILSRLYFDPENSTDHVDQDKPEKLKYDPNIQLSTQSQVFLSILINENEKFDELVQIIADLKNKIEESQTKTENITIIIINADNFQNNKNNQNNNEFFEECYGKISQQNEFLIYLYLNKYQDSFSLMQFIYEGLAKYFQPQYLYIQETKFTIDSNIFKDHLYTYGIICPLKSYHSIENKEQPLLLFYLIKQQQYTQIQNKYNSFSYDAFNCFQNYEFVQHNLGKHLRNLQVDFLDPNSHRVNQGICKLLNLDKMFVIQVGQLKYNLKQELSMSQIIGLHQEINLMMNQYSMMYPSAVKQTIMKIILLIDYFSLSSYLFIIIILPYYFMLENTYYKALQILIPIIPSFILILIILITLIMTIIFKVDEYQVTDKNKSISIYVKQVKQNYHCLIDINSSQQMVTLPQSKLIENEDMIINLNDIDNLVKSANTHKIKTNPKYLFNYLKFLHKLDIIFYFYNFFYFILSIYLLIVFIIKGGDHRLISIIIVAFVGFGLLTFISLMLYNQSNLWIHLKNTFINFIQINIIYDFSFNYTRSNYLERNYFKLKKFIQRIIANFIIIFIYIMIDYGQEFNGRIMCAITGYYAIRQLCQIILIIINFQKNDTKNQEDKTFQDLEQKNQIMKRLTNDQNKVVKLYKAILHQTQRINQSTNVENHLSQQEQQQIKSTIREPQPSYHQVTIRSNNKSYSKTVLLKNQYFQHQQFNNLSQSRDHDLYRVQNIENIEKKSKFSFQKNEEGQQNYPNNFEQSQGNNVEAHKQQSQNYANQQIYNVSDHDALLVYNSQMGDEQVDSIHSKVQSKQLIQVNKTNKDNLKQVFSDLMEQDENYSEDQSNRSFQQKQIKKEQNSIKKSDSIPNDSEQSEFISKDIKGFQ